jgi:hypothetical protein
VKSVSSAIEHAPHFSSDFQSKRMFDITNTSLNKLAG